MVDPTLRNDQVQSGCKSARLGQAERGRAALEIARDLLPEDSWSICDTIAALRGLATGAQAWEDIAQSLSLIGRGKARLRPLLPYVWLLAAMLRAQGKAWHEVAAHPWVKDALSETTLRNKHERARLPGGLKLSEIIRQYEEALDAEMRRLSDSQAASDAERARRVFEKGMALAEDQIARAGRVQTGFDDLIFIGPKDTPFTPLEREGELLDTLSRVNERAVRTGVAAYNGLRLINNQATEITKEADGQPGAETPSDPAGQLERLAQLQAAEAEVDKELADLREAS